MCGSASPCVWWRKPSAACCPKTKMGDAMYRKLKVYAGADHPHAAQQPQKIEVA